MEEVQSWWEVPAVAHFCYVFRSAFNLIFFEIAELESALLNIQDPDMSISLDQLIVRLLQGCYDDDESVDDLNWEEKLHELFNENCEDDENLFNDSQYFMHLTPRSKIEILYRLCEFRLDVNGALEAIKNIPSEDMQAKCMGKDSQNNTYWYFCDERLYKENPNAIKLNQTQKKNEGKNILNKSSKQVNARDKRTKGKPDTDKPWSIACYNVNDWEKLMKTFTKNKSTLEKDLATAIKNHLPILQEMAAEKDRLLRKRFMELAPKRSSSRISRVQEMKKIEEMKAQEKARRAEEQAEKERARIEAKKLKEEKESRQKRAEMRHKAIEERTKRAQLREEVRGTNEDDDYSDEDEDSSSDDSRENYCKTNVSRQHKIANSNIQRNSKFKENGLKKIEENEEEYTDEDSDEDSDEYEEDKNNSDSDYEASIHRTNNRSKRTKHSYRKTIEPTINNSRYHQRTYSGRRKQDNGQLRVSSRLRNSSKTVKYKFESDESEEESDEAPSRKEKNGMRTRFQQKISNNMDQSNSEESADENDSDDDGSKSDEIESKDNPRRLPIQKTFTVTKSSLAANDSSKYQDMINLNIPKVTLYKSNLLNSSGTSSWTLDSKAQKLHILNSKFDNSSPKRIKLDEGKSTASSTLKSSLLKENHVYKAVQRTPPPFITYGRIIPTKPAIVRLDFRKPPVSS